MEMKSFFGESGLTSTSANHVANMAKEVARNFQNYLANVRFVKTEMSIIGDDKSGTVSLGLNDSQIPDIQEALNHLSKLHSLIAYLREAIKEKERLAKEAQDWEDKDAHEEFDTKYTELQKAKPLPPKYITEEDVVKSWSVGEQERYLTLEATASVYGKYIHEDGAISNARKNLMVSSFNPIQVKENGRDTIIYKTIPSVSGMEVVDELFFNLQNGYRETQAELNGMKKRIKDTVEADKMNKDEVYRLAFKRWKLNMDIANRELQELMLEDSKKRQEMLKEIQNLKIVIPHRLEDVYNALKA